MTRRKESSKVINARVRLPANSYSASLDTRAQGPACRKCFPYIINVLLARSCAIATTRLPKFKLLTGGAMGGARVGRPTLMYPPLPPSGKLVCHLWKNARKEEDSRVSVAESTLRELAALWFSIGGNFGFLGVLPLYLPFFDFQLRVWF